MFDNCVSEGNAANSGPGGALFVGAGLADGVFTGARPDVTMNNVTVRNSKALRGVEYINVMPAVASCWAAAGPGDPAANPAVAPSGTQVGAVVMTDVVIENNEAEAHRRPARAPGNLGRADPGDPRRQSRDRRVQCANPNLDAGYYGGAEIRLYGATNVSRGGTLTLTDVTISNNEAQGDWARRDRRSLHRHPQCTAHHHH